MRISVSYELALLSVFWVIQAMATVAETPTSDPSTPAVRSPLHVHAFPAAIEAVTACPAVAELRRGRRAIKSSSSWAELNSHCRPVTRFSRRPARRSGVASLRTFTTYARRLGYLESALRASWQAFSASVESSASVVAAERRVVSETVAVRSEMWHARRCGPEVTESIAHARAALALWRARRVRLPSAELVDECGERASVLGRRGFAFAQLREREQLEPGASVLGLRQSRAGPRRRRHRRACHVRARSRPRSAAAAADTRARRRCLTISKRLLELLFARHPVAGRRALPRHSPGSRCRPRASRAACSLRTPRGSAESLRAAFPCGRPPSRGTSGRPSGPARARTLDERVHLVGERRDTLGVAEAHLDRARRTRLSTSSAIGCASRRARAYACCRRARACSTRPR